MVTGIETPNANFGKDNIPNDEENSGYNNRGKNCFPPFYIFHPTFETIQKWNQEGCYI
jgi:hypothetical protein